MSHVTPLKVLNDALFLPILLNMLQMSWDRWVPAVNEPFGGELDEQVPHDYTMSVKQVLGVLDTSFLSIYIIATSLLFIGLGLHQCLIEEMSDTGIFGEGQNAYLYETAHKAFAMCATAVSIMFNRDTDGMDAFEDPTHNIVAANALTDLSLDESAAAAVAQAGGLKPLLALVRMALSLGFHMPQIAHTRIVHRPRSVVRQGLTFERKTVENGELPLLLFLPGIDGTGGAGAGSVSG